MILFLDLGASFLKGLVFDPSTGNEVSRIHLPGLALSAIDSSDSSFLDPLCVAVQETVARHDITAVYISEEMHGFSVVERDGRGGHFYSWRCGWPYHAIYQDYFDGPEGFQIQTGLALRDGYGIWGLLSLGDALDERSRIGSLSSLLVTKIGSWYGISDISILQSQGLIDVRSRSYIDAVEQRFWKALPKIKAKTNDPIGAMLSNDREIPVFGGVGDLIGTLDGVSKDRIKGTLFVNSGTGSQIAMVDSGIGSVDGLGRPFEKRLGMIQDYLVISHIPCGRAINFFKKIALGIFPEKSEDEFWDLFNQSDPTPPELTGGYPDRIGFQLGIFDSAVVGYPGGISHLSDKVTFEEYIGSLVGAVAHQYSEIISSVMPHPSALLLCGGVFERSERLVGSISAQLASPLEVAPIGMGIPFSGLKRLLEEESSA